MCVSVTVCVSMPVCVPLTVFVPVPVCVPVTVFVSVLCVTVYGPVLYVCL